MYQGMSQCVSQQVVNEIVDHLFIHPLTGTNSVSLPVLFVWKKTTESVYVRVL